MSQVDPNRRFQIAYERARAAWAAANLQRAATLAGATASADAVVVPYFGGPHRIQYPSGDVIFEPTGRVAHPSIAIVLLHYLLTADGVPPADRWLTFRELPDGLFYARAFAEHAENRLAARYGADLAGFTAAATRLNGQPLDLADASYRFQALPRLAVAVLLWEGDDEFPGQARVLFDAHAGHYLPTEDLSGLGDWLAHRLG